MAPWPIRAAASAEPASRLVNPQRNGECGPLSNQNFGTVVSSISYDEDAITGWGHRNFNWEFAAGLERELLPRVSANAAYFRRWYGNFVITDDLAVGPADYDRFVITAPRDPRLPGGGGYAVEGYDIKPEKFGVPVQPLITLSSRYGKQRDYWQGADLTINARPRPGCSFREA
jgi:hypothetical protein